MKLSSWSWAFLPLARGARILVIGGSGRVGGSTCRALSKILPDAQLEVGGRDLGRFQKSKQRWEQLDGKSYEEVNFRHLDLADDASLARALAGASLVVNTAGPFQQKIRPEVLIAAVEARVPYVDVCDDATLAVEAKALSPRAKAAGVPAVISAGIWPGVDQMMALEACEMLGGAEKVDTLEFAAFTAGTGNAGQTILSATFLILAERALAYEQGKAVYYQSASDFQRVDFGPGVGERQIFRMNEIEAFTAHEVLGVPNIVTSFGTAPEGWNYLLAAMARLPKRVLSDRNLMQALAAFSEPIVRIVDKLVGSTNAMRVEAVGRDGRRACLRYAHEDLEVCVGIATAAFAAAVLRGDVAPGVYFPEEAFAKVQSRERLLREATRDAFLWDRLGP